MRKQQGFTLYDLINLLIVCIGVLGVIGWVLNIIKVIDTCCAVINGELVVRLIGIFIAPLGAVMGYI